jgi:asparagine synthase (glutamine-hydrolysing)
MSGIAGILNLDGAPVDREVLQSMASFLAYRGPDAQKIWCENQVGFGHAMLRTTFESQHEQQPCSLDGKTWITADARIDGRDALIDKLKTKSKSEFNQVTDVELILHAYQVWEDDCLSHLLGDFAFAIWDGTRKRLFCARDQFGVKLFYYARVGNAFVFSNTLNCVRRHPEVSDKLNDQAIGDFLLFGYNAEPTTTTFADIQRLLPAHCLVHEQGSMKIRRYWSLPLDRYIRYKKQHEYVDHFKEIFKTAVADRLRAESIAIWMSGGLDSSTVAAFARELQIEQGRPAHLQAYTVVYDSLIPDDERYYSGLVAKALDIPIRFFAGDEYKPFERWDDPELQFPEPWAEPFWAFGFDQLQQIATRHRVVLSGEGGDELLIRSGIWHILQGMPLPHALNDLTRYFLKYRQLIASGFGIRAKLKQWRAKFSDSNPFPAWLNPAFVTRYHLRERWTSTWKTKPALLHPWRPEAHDRLFNDLWQSVFEGNDSGVTRVPIEYRYPFLDLRVVNFLFAMPPLPWFVKKEILRVVMSGVLPEQVRLRPKTPLQADPTCKLLEKPDARWIDQFKAVPELARYVDREKIPQITGGKSGPADYWLPMLPFCLNHWLHNLKSLDFLINKENSHENRSEAIRQKELSSPGTHHLW